MVHYHKIILIAQATALVDTDCAGVCGGDTVVDECGDCGGDGSACAQTTLDINLATGWNWFSMNVVPEDASITAIIPNEDQAVDVVKGQSDYSQWYGDFGVWYPDVFSFDVTQTYKSFSYSPSVLSITGDDAETSTPIELAPNWNWIGYLPQNAWDVDTALGSVDFAHGDFLKTQTTSTTYYAGYGWYPGVTEGFVINPGDGLMLNVESSGTLIYPSGNPVLSDIDDNQLYLNTSNYAVSDWNINIHDYEFNGTVTSKVVVNGQRMGSEGDKIAVFANGHCRGVADAMKSPFEDDAYVFLLMVYGNTDSEEMTISYYDARNNIVYDNIQTLNFYPDMIKGNAIESHMVVYNENIAGPETYKLGAAYPNPFNPTTTIEFSVAEAGFTSIVVCYNLQGQMVTELVSDYKDIGEYEVQWNAFDAPSGVYFIQMSINSFTSNQKVMLIK